jgi:1-phosphatidylinositol-4-phosphate 5-kinase
MENQNTLLTRYYGIHRVKPSGGKKMRFLIMGSVFFTDNFIHQCYDLKGSTHGRSATEKEKLQEVPVLKDLDFLEKGVKISVTQDKAQKLIQQIEKDSQVMLRFLLVFLDIMFQVPSKVEHYGLQFASWNSFYGS